ncbi:MAG TPA: hypothetical protein VFT53_05995 [Candidatus Saccharimonadales bacterium]|nr:hypothetical protein [Candidatus Saccharimonadales bacterium]
MEVVLVTNPSYDVVTRHFSHWVGRVLKHMKTLKGVHVVELPGKKAHPRNLRKSIAKHAPDMVFFNGHGNHSEVVGHNGVVLVACHDASHTQLKGTIVHCLACQSGKTLGQELIKIGALAFIGYQEDFKFFYTKDDPKTQGHDDIAALFLEPAHLPMIALVSGKKAGHAYNEARRLYKKNFLTAYANNMDSDVLGALADDLRHMVIHGDHEASIA